MTDKEKLEKVRAEIERVKKNQEGVFTEYTDGKFDLCEYLLSIIDSMQKEPKECMYSKGNYTDKDRKVLCEGCEEECKFNKKEESDLNWKDMPLQEKKDLLVLLQKDIESVSKNLEEAARRYAALQTGMKDAMTSEYYEEYPYSQNDIKAFKAGSKWQKERLMAKAVDATVHIDAGGYPYIPQMELYDYEKDIPFAKEGDKYKVVLIKEG